MRTLAEGCIGVRTRRNLSRVESMLERGGILAESLQLILAARLGRLPVFEQAIKKWCGWGFG